MYRAIKRITNKGENMLSAFVYLYFHQQIYIFDLKCNYVRNKGIEYNFEQH